MGSSFSFRGKYIAFNEARCDVCERRLQMMVRLIVGGVLMIASSTFEVINIVKFITAKKES